MHTTIVLENSQGYGTAVSVDLSTDTYIVHSWDDENTNGNWTLRFSSLGEAEECLKQKLSPSLCGNQEYQNLVAAHDRAHRARIRAYQRPDDIFAYCCGDGTSVLTTRQQAEELGLDYPDRIVQTGTKEHTEVLIRERLMHHVYPNGADIAILAGQWCYRDELPEYPHLKADHIIIHYGSEPWYQWRLAKFQREGN